MLEATGLATTAARWSPSRSASGCSAARSPPGGRAGRTPAPRSPTTSRRSSTASCGCSTAPTRCWPTPARSAGHATVAEAVGRRRRAAAWVRAVVDGGVAAPGPAGRGARRLPRRAARPLRQPADAPPARPDRRRRLAEAADPHPARAARRARGGADARRAPPACSPPGCATCAASARRSTTCAPTRSSRSPAGPLPDAVPRVLDALDPALGADADVVAAVRRPERAARAAADDARRPGDRRPRRRARPASRRWRSARLAVAARRDPRVPAARARSRAGRSRTPRRSWRRRPRRCAECVAAAGGAEVLAVAVERGDARADRRSTPQLRPLTPLITWADARAREQARALRQLRPGRASCTRAPARPCTR